MKQLVGDIPTFLKMFWEAPADQAATLVIYLVILYFTLKWMHKKIFK